MNVTNIVKFCHLDKVAVASIDRVCGSLNAASQDVSSSENKEDGNEDKDKIILHLTAVPKGKLCEIWVS